MSAIILQFLTKNQRLGSVLTVRLNSIALGFRFLKGALLGFIPFLNPHRSIEVIPMNIRHLIPLSLALATIWGVRSQPSWAQELSPAAEGEHASLFSPSEASPSDLSVEDKAYESPSFSPSRSLRQERTRTAAEIRQARALYRSQQRIARQEYNLWLGHEPLRPSWSATPMTSSRYAPRRVYYVPAYVHHPAR